MNLRCDGEDYVESVLHSGLIVNGRVSIGRHTGSMKLHPYFAYSVVR